MAVGQLLRVGTLTDPARNLSAAIECFVTYCRAKNLSENTMVYYSYRLEAFRTYVERLGRDLQTAEITRQLVRDFVTSEIEARSPATANHGIRTLRVFFGFLTREGFLEVDPMVGVEKAKRRKPLIDAFTPEQIESVLAACGKDFQGMRDRAIILTLFDTGVRVSELCGLQLDDVCWKEQRLVVLGKGDKERVVGFGESAKHALAQYIARRGQLESKALFVTCYGDPVTRHRVARMVGSRCRKAGITGPRCSPHTFRHSFAICYLRNGADVFSLQKLLGHSDLSMTRRYCEISQTDALERHRLYSPADRLRVAEPAKGRRRLR